MSRTESAAPARPFSLTFVKATRAHEEHAESNRDYGLIDPESRLAVICDGVGDFIGAEQAARLAARTVRTCWRQRVEDFLQANEHEQTDELDAVLRSLLEQANKALQALDARLKRRTGRDDDKKVYAGTTIALALLPQEAGYLMGYAHIGDSRVYLLRGQEGLQRLTVDDGYFEWKIGKGELDAADAQRIEQASSAEQLSEQDREHFAQRNGISQDLGEKDITLHVGQIAIRPGDRVLLTTDGIHDNLTDAEIEETARRGARTTLAKTLLKRAVERSRQEKTLCLRAKKDDKSVITISCYALAEQ